MRLARAPRAAACRVSHRARSRRRLLATVCGARTAVPRDRNQSWVSSLVNLMNRVKLGEYGNQAFRSAIGPARNGEDTCLARRNFLSGARNRPRMRHGNDDRAVAIRMNQIAVLHHHAEYGDLVTERNRLGVGMRRRDVSGEKLKAWRPLVEVADRAIGNQSERAQADVNRRLHFAPKRAAARVGAVEIFDDDDRGFEAAVDMAVIVVLQSPLLGRGQTRWPRCANRRRARVANDGFQRWKATNERLARVAARLRRRIAALERIA